MGGYHDLERHYLVIHYDLERNRLVVHYNLGRNRLVLHYNLGRNRLDFHHNQGHYRVDFHYNQGWYRCCIHFYCRHYCKALVLACSQPNHVDCHNNMVNHNYIYSVGLEHHSIDFHHYS